MLSKLEKECKLQELLIEAQAIVQGFLALDAALTNLENEIHGMVIKDLDAK